MKTIEPFIQHSIVRLKHEVQEKLENDASGGSQHRIYKDVAFKEKKERMVMPVNSSIHLLSNDFYYVMRLSTEKLRKTFLRNSVNFLHYYNKNLEVNQLFIYKVSPDELRQKTAQNKNFSTFSIKGTTTFYNITMYAYNNALLNADMQFLVHFTLHDVFAPTSSATSQLRRIISLVLMSNKQT